MRIGVPYMTTVSAAAASKDLTVKATVKAELGISGTADDAVIDAWIHQASAQIATYLNRDVASETLIDRFRVKPNTTGLRLSRAPVTAVSSVTEDGDAVSSGLYRRDDVAGVLYRLDSSGDLWDWDTSGDVVVTYTGGWVALETVPHDVEAACIALVRSRWFARARDPLIRAETVPDVYAVQYQVGGSLDSPGGMPADVAAMLAPYVRASL